jgi:hypothetical protein
LIGFKDESFLEWHLKKVQKTGDFNIKISLWYKFLVIFI